VEPVEPISDEIFTTSRGETSVEAGAWGPTSTERSRSSEVAAAEASRGAASGSTRGDGGVASGRTRGAGDGAWGSSLPASPQADEFTRSSRSEEDSLYGSPARGAGWDTPCMPCRLGEQFNDACTSSRESAPARGDHQRDPAAESPPGAQRTDDHGDRQASPARGTSPGIESPASRRAADQETGATSAPTVQEQRRRPPTPEKLRDVMDLYPLEMLRTINPIRMTRARGRGRGGCLLNEEPTKFEEANTDECWRRAMDDELGSIRDNNT
jgi:hypothetical protein